MKKLTLSVTIPNYNHSQFIGGCLEAVLGQSLLPDEIIVVDDASTDNSVEVIEKIAKKNSIIKFIKNKKNLGMHLNGMKAFHEASGDYVYSHAADDRVLPGFFQKSMEILEQNPTAGICFSDAILYEEETGKSYEDRLNWCDKPRHFTPTEFLEIMKPGESLHGFTSILKREALLDQGGYIPELQWASDWFIYHVLAFRMGICYVPEPLIRFSLSPASYSGSRGGVKTRQKEVCKYLLKLLKSPVYRDVLPFFAKSGVMSITGTGALLEIIQNPKHWDLDTFRLIQKPAFRIWPERSLRHKLSVLKKLLFRDE